MKVRCKAITCDAQRLLTKSQMWGKWWHGHATGRWMGGCAVRARPPWQNAPTSSQREAV